MTSVPSPYLVMTALDVSAAGTPGVDAVLRALGGRVGRMTGAEVVVALGASVFERAGRVDLRPRQLRLMPAFAGDLLDPARCHGDLLVEVGASSVARAEHAFSGLVAGLPGLRMRWSMRGFRPENRVEDGRGLTRNVFGFSEGFANPDAGRAESVVRVVEPGWGMGGSYQVVRIIRVAASLWDADPVGVQERVIGRRRDGRWLDGTPAFGEPRFGVDPGGAVTPLDAHVRRANPREAGVEAPPLVRRGYSFDRGRDAYGQRDEGLLFSCFQADLVRGFEAVQHRLAGEALSHYTLTVGGGYFFVPPQGALPGWPETGG